MSLQHFGKGALRVAKNYTMGYSDTQAKVRDATSNDPWGPSGTQMNEIAQLTYNQNDFVEIMEMLDKRLNDKGKNWRHVFKSLTVLDYLLHAGSENVVLYFKDNLYIIKTLKEFQYVDEDGKDCGANVRQKAKDISNLLSDAGRLREERRNRASMRDRMIRGNPGMEEDEEDGGRRSVAPQPRKNRTTERDDDELRRAIEASKQSHAEEQARLSEENDIQRAIRLSEEEEARRNKAVQDSNAAALFDDQSQLPPPADGSNNPFPFTDPTPYATGLQPQFTVQPQYTMQPQFTSFNPYQQQAQQEAMQAEYLRQQQEWMRQQQELQAQQAQALQQQQQEEWLRQQQALQAQQQAQQLFAQPTGFGSNNPFAPTFSPSPASHTSPPSTNGTGPSFNLQGTYANSTAPSYGSTPSPAPTSTSSQSRPEGPSYTGGAGRGAARADQEHAHLANLFANRDDGQDTFGNVGALRYGQTQVGRTAVQQTGVSANNPFALQPQQTHNPEQPFFSI
ncbi:hypothetical protein J3R82DRAFT_7785 [Butyriboletus roseoflavus]|nr:hypothetical protein J3R82DRAFT_7785 [Butyriboletus roseoflavus]